MEAVDWSTAAISVCGKQQQHQKAYASSPTFPRSPLLRPAKGHLGRQGIRHSLLALTPSR